MSADWGKIWVLPPAILRFAELSEDGGVRGGCLQMGLASNEDVISYFEAGSCLQFFLENFG